MRDWQLLITGGTGFFAQGFVRRLLQDASSSSRIGILSRNEWNQYRMRGALGDDPRLRWFIGDVREQPRLLRAMQAVQTVIHAAALKRVEVGEYNPTEMVRTNVDGAINVIWAATEARVENVVAISSDKACEPLNCYGATKLVAEKLFLRANETSGAHGPAFAVARYGNVAGSTGSVIPMWRAMAAAGLSVKITDPDCTRYWMSLAQAIDMVLWCVGRHDLSVPNLAAYRLGDLAEALGVTTEVVGLGRGEKKHETMMSAGEMHLFLRFHPIGTEESRITQGTEPLTSETARRMSVDELREALKDVP